MAIKARDEGGLSIEVRLPLAISQAADTGVTPDDHDTVSKAAASSTACS